MTTPPDLSTRSKFLKMQSRGTGFMCRHWKGHWSGRSPHNPRTPPWTPNGSSMKASLAATDSESAGLPGTEPTALCGPLLLSGEASCYRCSECEALSMAGLSQGPHVPVTAQEGASAVFTPISQMRPWRLRVCPGPQSSSRVGAGSGLESVLYSSRLAGRPHH